MMHFNIIDYKYNCNTCNTECKKCTPSQIMLFKLSLNLHKVLNDIGEVPKKETIRILEQSVFTRRQLKFEIYRNNHCK